MPSQPAAPIARQASTSMSCPASRSVRARLAPPKSAQSLAALSRSWRCSSLKSSSIALPLRIRQAEHAFCDDVSVDLGRAATDREPPHLEQLGGGIDRARSQQNVVGARPRLAGGLHQKIGAALA